MSKKMWFIHMTGQTLGPLPTDAVKVMLSQMRIHFADYIWTTGFTKWVRISEVDEFMSLLPAYPSQGIPSENTEISNAEVNSKTQEYTKNSHNLEKESQAKQVVPLQKPIEKKQKKSWPKIRKNLRVRIDGGVKISQFGDYDVVDISEGGVFVKSIKNLEIGTEIKFVLHTKLSPEGLALTGIVIRHGVSHGVDGFAIEFVRLNPMYKRLIKEYVAQFDE